MTKETGPGYLPHRHPQPETYYFKFDPILVDLASSAEQAFMSYQDGSFFNSGEHPQAVATDSRCILKG